MVSALAAQVRHLKLSGLTLMEIGDQLGLTKGAVAGIIWRELRGRGKLPPMPKAKSRRYTPEPSRPCLWPSGWPHKFECKGTATADSPFCERHLRIQRARETQTTLLKAKR